MRLGDSFRLCLVYVKYFRERKIFSSVWLHYENCSRKYFHVFSNILKNAIFHHHLHKTHHHTTRKPPKHHHPHHHNNKKKKIRDQRLMGLWVDQNHIEKEIGSWVRGSGSKAKGRRLVRGAKALGRRRSRRLMGRRLWVEDRFMGS